MGNTPSAPPPPQPWPWPSQPAPSVNQPPLVINLTVATSKTCSGCVVDAGAGTSSSAITLTRNVLPAIAANRKPVLPPSNLPRTGGTPEHFNGPPDNEWCKGGCWYTPPYPSNASNGKPATTLSASANPPTLLSNKDEHWKNNGTDYADEYRGQKAEETAVINSLTLAASAIIANRMWNPSDDPKDPLGSQAINHKNYGALTKLFLKPTLPFAVNYSGM